MLATSASGITKQSMRKQAGRSNLLPQVRSADFYAHYLGEVALTWINALLTMHFLKFPGGCFRALQAVSGHEAGE
jgi:hypothetical protein